MNVMNVAFRDRLFTTLKTQLPVRFTPVRYSWHKRGGPDTAEIAATGDLLSLWRLCEWLRYEVTLYDQQSEAVWWGFVHTVEIRFGALKVGMTLDGMANRVRIAYTQEVPGEGIKRYTTSWAQDELSVSEYGYLETMESLSDASATLAEARRDYLLSQRAWPVRRLAPSIGFADASASATLICKGWWHTLDWRYYEHAGSTSETKYEAEPENVTATVGTSVNHYASMGFILPGTDSGEYEITEITLKAAKIGNPNDGLVIDVCAGDGNAPGTAIYTTDVMPASGISNAHTWTTWRFNVQARVTANTQYSIVVRRTGALSDAQFYRVAAHTAQGYTNGMSRVWNGAAWVVYDGGADMLFRIRAQRVVETTAQIQDVIAASCPFITATHMDASSNIYTVQYRDGDARAAKVLDGLLDAGTSTGRELLAIVARNRTLVVYEETPQGIRDYYLTSTGRLLTPWFGPVLPSRPVVGVYVRILDAPDEFFGFIDSMEYVAASGTATYRLRDTLSGINVMIGVRNR